MGGGGGEWGGYALAALSVSPLEMGGGVGGLCLSCTVSVTTRNVFCIGTGSDEGHCNHCERPCRQMVSVNHNLWRERSAEAGNRSYVVSCRVVANCEDIWRVIFLKPLSHLKGNLSQTLVTPEGSSFSNPCHTWRVIFLKPLSHPKGHLSQTLVTPKGSSVSNPCHT